MDDSSYLFDIIQINDPLEAVKHALMNIVEGCVFINPIGFITYSAKINGYRANICSESYKVYGDLQKIEVKLQNLADPDNNEKNIKVYVYDTRSLQNENPIFAFENGPNLLEQLIKAEVTVFHENGQNIRIECQSIELTDSIKVTDVNIQLSMRRYDSRSMSSAKYVTHSDIFIDKRKLKV
jgi:hypothetical protein